MTIEPVHIRGMTPTGKCPTPLSDSYLILNHRLLWPTLSSALPRPLPLFSIDLPLLELASPVVMCGRGNTGNKWREIGTNSVRCRESQ